MFFESIVLIISGFGAGVVTGFASASAAVIMTPILVIFLGYSPHFAVGISLITDVFASTISAINYYQKKNIDVKGSLIMLLFLSIGAIASGFISFMVDGNLIIWGTSIFVLFLGIQFLKKPIYLRIEGLIKKYGNHISKKNKLIVSSLAGLVIGSLVGIFGASGGIAMLLILTLVLRYRVVVALGTSVFLMIFVALFGSIGHFINISVPLYPLFFTIIGAIIGSFLSSRYANLISEEKLSKIIGSIIFLIGLSFVLNLIIK